MSQKPHSPRRAAPSKGRVAPPEAERTLALFKKTPLLRARDLVAAGISRETLRRLLTRGLLEQPGRGLYRLVGGPMSADASIADAVRASPHMVVALLSALRLHGLTTQLPHDLWVYIGQKARAPARSPVRLRVFRVSDAALSLGVEMRTIDGVPVRVTTVARTLVDCFKRRGDVGLDVAIEALRDAKRLRKVDMNEVWRLAEERRALTYMRPFLEALA